VTASERSLNRALLAAVSQLGRAKDFFYRGLEVDEAVADEFIEKIPLRRSRPLLRLNRTRPST